MSSVPIQQDSTSGRLGPGTVSTACRVGTGRSCVKIGSRNTRRFIETFEVYQYLKQEVFFSLNYGIKGVGTTVQFMI